MPGERAALWHNIDCFSVLIEAGLNGWNTLLILSFTAPNALPGCPPSSSSSRPLYELMQGQGDTPSYSISSTYIQQTHRIF